MVDKSNNSLLEIYENAQEEFRRSGYHPHPANLLAMLLLQEKDTFEPLAVSEGVFYERYQNIIDDKINKVLTDFKISREEVEAFIERDGILTNEEDFESDKVWFVFGKGFGIMHGEMMYQPEQTAYEMYCHMDNKASWYKMTEYGLGEFFPKRKGKTFRKHLSSK